jgi:predicted HTH transcriptional regulator
LAGKLGVSIRTAQRILDKMVKNGKICRIGAKKGGHWEIIA